MVRIGQWRVRREAQAAVARPSDQSFRGFVQINLIRPR